MLADDERRPYSQQRIAPESVNPYASELDEVHYVDNILSTKGRIRRTTFGIRRLVVGMLLFFLFIIIGLKGNAIDGGMIGLFLLFVIFSSIFTIIQTIKRFHDLNMEGTSYFLLFVPLYNIYILFRLFFEEGTIGTNRFGPDPKPRPIYTPPANEDVFIIK